MATVAERIRDIRTGMPAGVTLVCVSKFHPAEAIREAYQAGERDFGESRVQELQQKVAVLPTDIRWHFIGHLQTNKVRDLLRLRPYLIQSVDSERLLRALNDEAAKQGIVQNILLEVHVAREQTKSGFLPDELAQVLPTLSQYPNISVRGLMGMATNTEDEQEIRRCYQTLKALNDQIVNDQIVNGEMVNLSMGMSDDYRIAIDCGSTMVRVGSAIFGERSYTPQERLKAFFFDMDGVLFDSMPTHAAAWEEVMQRHGFNFRAQDAYINEGRTGQSVIYEAITTIEHREPTEEEIWDIYREKNEAFLRRGEPKPMRDVDRVLRLLQERQRAIWIVTGSGQKSLFARLERCFPGVFAPERMVTAYDVKHGKPDPEPYLKAWERSGYPKEQCCVIENAPLGVRAGKAAGLYTIAVNTGPLPDELLQREGADQVFPDMDALYNWLVAK